MPRPHPDRSSDTAGTAPTPAPLVDRFGRVHTDLRVSLTDRCTLRCTYCMPAEGLDWLPRAEVLTDDEIAELAAFAAEHGYQVRFIESMPLDAQGAWDRERMVTAEEILDRLGERFDLVPVGREGNAPAEEWRIAGTETVVGVIASVTRPFCGSCDRVRLTADGQLRNCLFAAEESDLRALLRGGADDTELEAAWRTCVGGKGPGHAINSDDFRRPERPMSAIGG